MGRRRARGLRTPPAAEAPPEPAHATRTAVRIGALIGALLVVAVALDAFRVGFFADDFHFLDIARRVPLTDLLTGADGMWPWYRPLSRELFFKLLVLAGPHRLFVAHAATFLALAGIITLMWRIGCRALHPVTVALAVVLFATFDHTKFLVAWASGFQDLLATLLILLAVDSHQSGRHGLAWVSVLLAPLAKETGFVAVPLLIASELTAPRHAHRIAALLRYASAAGVAGLIHIAARMSWGTLAGPSRGAVDPERLASVLFGAAHGFVMRIPSVMPGTPALVGGLVAAALSIGLVHVAGSRPRDTAPGPHPTSSRQSERFLLVAAALGVLPVVFGHLLRLTFAHSYHLFPAIPWVALLIAHALRSLPPWVWRSAVPLLVAWNVGASGFVRLDMDQRESWGFRRWDWSQALRFDAQTQRLAEDVRSTLRVRPESLVVLYEDLPGGAFFQTEDGPATRVALGDPSVRAFGIRNPPSEVREDRLAILTFDAERLHLRAVDWSDTETLLRGMNAVSAGRGDCALALLEFHASNDPTGWDRRYVRAAARLLLGGPAPFLSGLREAGLGDTTGDAPARLSDPLAETDAGLASGMRRMLQRPASAEAHAALAESLLVRDVLPAAAMEYRIAWTLDPSRLDDRFTLAMVMLGNGGTEEATRELEALLEQPLSTTLRQAASRQLAEIRRVTAAAR